MVEKRILTATLLIIAGLSSLVARAAEPPTAGIPATAECPRLIVLTDIGGGDPDDQQSMIRLMLHCNEFDIEGLIASAPTLEDLKETGTKPQLIHEIVDAYGPREPRATCGGLSGNGEAARGH